MTLQQGGGRGGGRARRAEEVEERRRKIELRIISAQDLKKPRLQMGRMRAYAAVYADGDRKTAARTGVDERGGQNPVWNDLLTLSVREAQLRKGSLACLTVDIYTRCAGRLPFFRLRDRLVGSARIFLSDVVKLGAHEDGAAAAFHNPIQCLAFWVRLPSGEPHGILNVWIPPFGEFLRRHHDSQEFSRILAFPPLPAAATSSVRLPPSVRSQLAYPADGAASPASVAAPSAHLNGPTTDIEAFTFNV